MKSQSPRGGTESATGLLSSELSSCNFGFGSRVKRRILLSDRAKTRPDSLTSSGLGRRVAGLR